MTSADTTRAVPARTAPACGPGQTFPAGQA
jgi:hypothetical protein